LTFFLYDLISQLFYIKNSFFGDARLGNHKFMLASKAFERPELLIGGAL